MSEQQESLGRILIAIREEEPRQTVLKDLEKWGFLVEAVQDGIEVLDRLQRDPLPDLVILDVFMPGMDGYQTRERMLTVERLSRIPVLMRAFYFSDAALNLSQHVAIYQEIQIDGFVFLDTPGIQSQVYNAVLNVLARRGVKHGTEPARAEEAPRQEASSALVVYIADGDPLVRQQISRSLQSAGYQTMEAESGKEVQAETSARTVRPDAIICAMDVLRPDAFELREHLLADRKLRHIPFIILAERPADEAAFFETMSRLDYDAFLFKPLTPDTPIVPVLENVLRRRRIGE